MIVNTEQNSFLHACFSPAEFLKGPGNWKRAGEGEESRHLHHRILEARCRTPVDKCRKIEGQLFIQGW